MSDFAAGDQHAAVLADEVIYAHAIIDAVRKLHGLPEADGVCTSCNVQWPCPTAAVVGGLQAGDAD